MMKASWNIILFSLLELWQTCSKKGRFHGKNGSEKRFLYQCLFHFHLKGTALLSIVISGFFKIKVLFLFTYLMSWAETVLQEI